MTRNWQPAKKALCVQASNQAWLYDLFEQGMKKIPNADKSLFADLECDDVVPEGHAYAGQAKLGSSCYVKCKDGAHFGDVDGDVFEMRCQWLWHKDYTDFDILHNTLNYKYKCGQNCGEYPHCVPDE
jgi:hypothetical protein